MVGSRRTWNTDEPGLGRPKALPSSAPCMASVIWMVLSGRHMPVSVHWLNTQRLEVLHTVTRPHATSGKSPTLPQCRSFYTPLSTKPPPQLILHFQSPSLSPLLFPLHMTTCSHCDLITPRTALGHLARCMCYGMRCVFTGVWAFACVFVSGMASSMIQ